MPPPPPPPQMHGGQILDLETGDNIPVPPEMTEEAILAKFPELRFEVSNDGQGLPADSTAADLVSLVVKLHQERVALHKAFDSAFKFLLTGEGGGSAAVARTYPGIVAAATRRFQQISLLVRDVAAALQASASATSGDSTQATESANEAATLIRKLQELERERLQLVAAFHAEQGRAHAAKGRRGRQRDADLANHEATCADYRRRLGKASEEIEETVSELRYCAADLREAG